MATAFWQMQWHVPVLNFSLNTQSFTW